MTALTDNIASFIPQRPPFVMIDALTAYEDKITRSSFLITTNNIFVDNNKFTEAGLVENIAQTAAARAGYIASLNNKPVQVGYIGSVKNLFVHSLPTVNDTLQTEIIVENQVFDVTIIKGTITCNTVVMAECEMKIFITHQNKYLL